MQRTSSSRSTSQRCDRRVSRPALLYIWNLAVLRDIPVTKKFLLFAALLLLPTISRAQVAPAGKGGNQQLYVGATFSDFDPDYGWQRFTGLVYTPITISPHGWERKPRVRFLRFNQLADIHEDNYLIGPRYNFPTALHLLWQGTVRNGRFQLPLQCGPWRIL